MVGSTSKVKSFEIDKRLVHEAWMKVQANGGAPGVDAVSIGGFREAERDNLYKLWNRMSSGSYCRARWGRWRYRRIMGRGSGCWVCPMWPTESPRGGGDAAGGEAGADLPPGQLRLPSWAFGPRRVGRDSTALLETGLGVGP